MARTNNPNVKFSLRKGLRFRFIVQDKELIYQVKAWNGKEIVWLEDVKISEARIFKMRSHHEFVIDSVPYKLNFTVDSLLTGRWHCCLLCEERVVKCYDLSVKSRLNLLDYFILFVMALIYVYLLPESFLWLVLLIAFIGGSFQGLNRMEIECQVRYE